MKKGRKRRREERGHRKLREKFIVLQLYEFDRGNK